MRSALVIALVAGIVGCTDSSAPDTTNLLTVDEQMDAEAVRHLASQLGYKSATSAKTTVLVSDFEATIKSAKTSPSIYAISASVMYGEVAVGASINGLSTDRVTDMVANPDENAEDWVKVGHDGAAELYRRCILIGRCKDI